MPSYALIADADEGARAELVQLLARLNYAVVEAGDGHRCGRCYASERRRWSCSTSG